MDGFICYINKHELWMLENVEYQLTYRTNVNNKDNRKTLSNCNEILKSYRFKNCWHVLQDWVYDLNASHICTQRIYYTVPLFSFDVLLCLEVNFTLTGLSVQLFYDLLPLMNDLYQTILNYTKQLHLNVLLLSEILCLSLNVSVATDAWTCWLLRDSRFVIRKE